MTDSISFGRPRPAPHATLSVPGDKSISHRALLCAAVADGTTAIRNLNAGADVACTREALRALGVPIEGSSTVTVGGVRRFEDPAAPLDCGNSGSTMRMLAGLIAGRVDVAMDGDASLRRRPMERVATPLRAMGAKIETAPGGTAPLVLRRAGAPLRGVTTAMTVASAQVKSALLFAGLAATGETRIIEPRRTRDHTERMLQAMGARIRIFGQEIVLAPSTLHAIDEYVVPGDISAAFFFIAGAAIASNSVIRIDDVGVNPTRTAALDVVREMGVDVRTGAAREEHGEPRAAIEIRGGRAMQNVTLAEQRVANAIDEIPTLCALAAFGSGDWSVRGAAELRTKESDRIATTASLLRSFGALVDEHDDGLTVHGGAPLAAPQSADTHGDHRIGMAAALLALGTDSPIRIENAACIETSFQGFEAAWRAAFLREDDRG